MIDQSRKRWRELFMGFCLVALLLSSSLLAGAMPLQSESPRYFVYVSDKRIITAELSSASKVILNYINLSDVIELIESQGLLVIDSLEKGYRGHLFQTEVMTPGKSRYFVNDLVKPAQFSAFDVMGNFRYEGTPQKVYVQLGSRLAELEPIASSEFDVFASKVSSLDLSIESGRAVLDAGFWRGQGFLHQVGSEEAERIQARYRRPDPAPPVILENPLPRLLSSFSHLPDPVVVQVRVEITEMGGVLNPTVARELDPELDRLAIQVVMNSWTFLPAIANGQPVAAETVLNVQFQR